MRPFSAPYRAIAIPDRDGGAGEGLAGRNDRGEQEQAEHRPIRNADDGSIQIPRRPKPTKARREAPSQTALLAMLQPGGARAGLGTSRRPAS